MSSSESNKTAKSDKLSDIFIGTAGYSYAHWRKAVFYPNHVTQANELRHYSGILAAVEINASFHGVPREETLRAWAQKAKSGFQFSFKVPQEITHVKRLENMQDSLSFFVNRLQTCLEASDDGPPQDNNPNLGPILFQLPPSLPKNVEKIHEIARLVPSTLRIAFEFRNKSWYCEEVYQALQQHDFGLCENISPDHSTHHIDKVTANTWHYIRSHKNGDRLVTDYSDAQLASIADQLMVRRRNNIVQYCYFLNDHEGNGPRNAQTLIRFIKERTKSTTLVHNWKPDPVARSISSLFANNHSTATTPLLPKPKPQPRSSESKRPAAPTMKSFFSPASSSAKRPKVATNAASRVAAAKTTPSAAKKGTITNFFSKKT